VATNARTISAANDLRIIVSELLVGTWDPTVTTITVGGEAAGSVNTAVTYADGNRTLVVDITSDIGLGHTFTIRGPVFLSGGTDGSDVLYFSTDGGVSSVEADGTTTITIETQPVPHALTGTPLSIPAGTTTDVPTLTFTVGSATAITNSIWIDIVQVSIDAAWDSTVTAPVFGGSEAAKIAGTVSYGDSDTTLKMTVNSALAVGGTLTISGLKVIGGSTLTETPRVLAFQDDAPEVPSYTDADTTTRMQIVSATGTATSPSVTIDVPHVSIRTNASFAFTTQNAIPATGKIKFTFPSTVNVGEASTVTCSTMDGAFAKSVSGQVVTITRSGGSSQAAAAENCTISNVIPIVTGSSGNFTVQTTNSGDTAIDTSASFPGPEFHPASTSTHLAAPSPVTGVTILGEGDGTSVRFCWTNPTDTDLATVRLYRSETENVVGTFIGSSTIGCYTDSGLTLGHHYDYLIRPVDTTGNETQDATEYEYTAVAPQPGTGTVAPETPGIGAGGTTTSTPIVLNPGDLVKADTSEVYFIADAETRYVFTNETVFLSWYKDFSAVRSVPFESLRDFRLAGAVLIRPGTALVKIVSSPKVYAVEPGGVLRWITTQTLAEQIFGTSWSERVSDVDPSDFDKYTVGAAVNSAELIPGMLVRIPGAASTYVVYIARQGTTLVHRDILNGAFASNNFDEIYVVMTSLHLPETGQPLTTVEYALHYPNQPGTGL